MLDNLIEFLKQTGFYMIGAKIAENWTYVLMIAVSFILLYLAAAVTAYLVSGWNPAITFSKHIYHKDIHNHRVYSRRGLHNTPDILTVYHSKYPSPAYLS